MKERPILFSAPMVRAILDGRKTQTRRPVKWPVLSACDGSKRRVYAERDVKEMNERLQTRQRHPSHQFCPLGQPGDRLWVRETWGLMAHTDPTDWHKGSVAGASPDEIVPTYGVEHHANWRVENENAFWRPSIHMPRWASRITLEIVRVSVERVQDITDANAFEEGAPTTTGCLDHPCVTSFRQGFHDLWQSIYGTWAANPWVWAVEFRRAKP